MSADILFPSQETFGASHATPGVREEEIFGIRTNFTFDHFLEASSGRNGFLGTKSEWQLGVNFISAEELDKRLPSEFPNSASSRSKPLILIDLRTVFQYQEGHIRQSINLTNCTLLSKRIETGKLQLKEYLGARTMFDGTQDIVIYEQRRVQNQPGTEEGRSVTDFAKLIFKTLIKVKLGTAKIQILRGGFDTFRQKYPQHCTQGVKLSNLLPLTTILNNDEIAFLNWEASEILENLYLGGLHDAQNDELLDKLGITHILNCCKTNSRKNEGDNGKYRYLQLMYNDNLEQSLDEKLAEALKFIDSAMQQPGAKVLIHCYAGVSRSAAVTIAYMMHKMGMGYEESYRQVKQKRSIVAPNINFVSQLLKYEENIHSFNKEE